MNRSSAVDFIVTYKHFYTSKGGLARTVVKRRKVKARNISAALSKAKRGNPSGGKFFDFVVERVA